MGNNFSSLSAVPGLFFDLKFVNEELFTGKGGELVSPDTERDAAPVEAPALMVLDAEDTFDGGTDGEGE